jgi:ATP/maltotriose-dependent transcriptional regulator MalT
MTDDLIERLRKQRPNGECVTVGRLMDDAANEIERLTAELERRKYDTMHTCHADCQREACVLRREVDALRAERDAAADAMYAEFMDATRTISDIVYAGVSGKCRHTSDRNRAATALKGSTDADLVYGTLGDSDGDDGA